MGNVKTMENTKTLTIEDMINAEISKIEAGNANEQNVLKLNYLNDILNEISQEWKTINSSREREDSQYVWRAVNNEANWIKTILLEGKLKTIYNNISAIKNTRKVILPDEPLAQKLEALETCKNEVQEEYVDGLVDYDRICRERAMFQKDGLIDRRAYFTPEQILHIAKKLSDEEKVDFWHKYFILADKYIEPELSSLRLNAEKQMGE